MISGLLGVFWDQLQSNKQLVMEDVLEFTQTDIQISTRDELEQIMQKKGDLTGMTIAPDIDVAGLNFSHIKMDKTVLQSLIKMGANLSGVDLSYQDLNGTDLTNVDLSYANCTGTEFFFTKLIGTNLTGVDLNTAAFDSYTVHFIDSVIVSFTDRHPYIKNLQNKLLFILSHGQTGQGAEGLLYQSSPDYIKGLYKQIMFDVGESCLKYGEKDGGGSQSLCLGDRLDRRYINTNDLTEAEIEEHQRYAEKMLFGNDDFTVPQKALFHHMRAAMWLLIKLDCKMHIEAMSSGQDLGMELDAELTKIDALMKIYVMGQNNQPRVNLLLKTICFEAVFPLVSEKYCPYGGLDRRQSEPVFDFFASHRYCW